MTQLVSLPSAAVTRRHALQIGTGMFGLGLARSLQAASVSPATDISCIFLFHAGGPSQFETFDPKPDAPAEVRGLWDPISTSVPGTQICEKLPLLAGRMDKVTIVRSWQGKSGSHPTGSQHVASGLYPPAEGQYFPNFGCLVSALQGNRVPGVPSHFGIPVAARYTNPSGYLGAGHAAFDIEGNPAAAKQTIGKLNLEPVRFEDRRSLLTQLDNLERYVSANDAGPASVDRFSEEAIALLTTDVMRRAVNLDEEPEALRERYGANIYGQRVLLARRLVEAGARFVTINQAVQGGLFGEGTSTGTWDNHHLLFESMMSFKQTPTKTPAGYNWHNYNGPGNLPQLDMSLSALLDDLDDRGLLDTTLVVAMGEFGRTPRINKDGGRDHYPAAGNVLLAGAGVCRGAVIGTTDRIGARPITRPWTPEDFAASIYHALGIDPHTTYFPRLTRPTPISTGQVIDGLFG